MRSLAVALLLSTIVLWPTTVTADTDSLPLKSGPVIVDFDAAIFAQDFFNSSDTGDVDIPGRLDLDVKYDGDKGGLWKGFSIDLHALYRFGDDYESNRGGVLSPYNTAAALPVSESDTFALTNLNFSQNFNDKFILQFGRVDFVLAADMGYGIKSFWNASYASPLINVMTTPMVTPLLLGLTWVGTENRPTVVVQVFDTRNTPTESGLDDLFSDGTSTALVVVQDTNFWSKKGSVVFRAAYTSKTVTDFENPIIDVPGEGLFPETTHGTWDATLGYTQTLGGKASNNWDVKEFFLNLGVAPQTNTPFGYTTTLGIRGTSPLGYNGENNWGLGYYYNALSTSLEDSIRPTVELKDEYAPMAYFDWKPNRWFSIGVDAQLVSPAVKSTFNPVTGTTTNNDTVLILGLRTVFSY
ncbi:MAG: hypothetical protein GWO88_00425 [Planctomycetia bacterium]|nr:hypothetical protein [Planctomycetia bacterium]